MIANVNKEFWNGKKVFLTGHTGFKGTWLAMWLIKMGANVKGFALQPPTSPSLYQITNVSKNLNSTFGDIRDFGFLSREMLEFNPEILIHMAAQPLVRDSYVDPLNTFSTNVLGTANVLQSALKCQNLQSILSVTTDKCYENKEWDWGYRENEPLGGHDPYSSSKACAELVTNAYSKSFFSEKNMPAVATARAGNVIGGGDWSKDRLIPDILKNLQNNKTVTIRQPSSVRPWQHVLEPLSGYLILSEKLFNNGQQYSGAWNFGPNEDGCKEVGWIVEKMVAAWKSNSKWELDISANPHEAKFLKLDCSKAKNYLGWNPKWNLEITIEKIVNWHKSWISGQNMSLYCENEIDKFINSK